MRIAAARRTIAATLTATGLVATVLEPSGAQAATPGPARAGTGSVIVLVHTSSGVGGLRSALARVAPSAAVRHELGYGASRRGDHVISVRIPADDEQTAMTRLATLPGVTSVEPPVERTLSDFVPDDPDYSQQASYFAAIDAPAAWARQKGSAAVTIAVVDSGVDETQPDLAGKIDAGYNAIDPSSHSVTDAVGHGTFVAGVAAADTDNGVGIAGAGFDTHLLAVKVAGDDDEVDIDNEIAGIRWAADHGADIINLSLGGSQYSKSEAAAVAYAQSKGALVVAAAGNDATSTKQYPAAYPGVVSVAATDPARRTRASFSSYGPWVTLAAPGVNLRSTSPVKGSTFFAAGGYASASGTSFSAPLVSGEAALLKAQDPAATSAQLRAALIASAHGYRGLGLGAGQVDFDLALDHVAPTTVPTGLVPTGSQNEIPVQADSTAPAVAFRLDNGAYATPVPVRNGVAATTLASYGYADGRHVVSAVDCSAYGQCNTTAQTATFDLASDPPSITSPTDGAALTGLVHVNAARSGGGGLRLLVDGHPDGFRGTAPYTFALSTSSLTDGRHSLAVQLCSVDGTRCAGPVSPAVSVDTAALHPRITGLSPTTISPVGDRAHRAATLRFSLPSTQSVRVEVLGPAGSPVASAGLGTLRAGIHTWTWRGSAGGHRLPDGRYTLALATSSGSLQGWVAADVTIHSVAPTITTGTGSGTVFYPYPDGYRDTFTTRTSVGDTGILTLTVSDARGAVVRRIAEHVRAGQDAISWNGRDAHGRLVAAGRYRFRLTVTDGLGNARSTRTQTVLVSGKRLRRETVSVSVPAGRALSANGSDRCAGASRKASAYPDGLLLTNRCGTADYDIALAQYAITVPTALRYAAIAIDVLGRTGSHGAQLTASIQRTDGVLEVPAYVTVHPGATAWHTIVRVSGADHVDARHRVNLTIVLTSALRGPNIFDTAQVRLRLTVVVLR